VLCVVQVKQLLADARDPDVLITNLVLCCAMCYAGEAVAG
jgi:hypothetical protein